MHLTDWTLVVRCSHARLRNVAVTLFSMYFNHIFKSMPECKQAHASALMKIKAKTEGDAEYFCSRITMFQNNKNEIVSFCVENRKEFLPSLISTDVT